MEQNTKFMERFPNFMGIIDSFMEQKIESMERIVIFIEQNNKFMENC